MREAGKRTFNGVLHLAQQQGLVDDKCIGIVGQHDETSGERSRERRQALDLSLRELARQVACTPPFLSDIGHGRRLPSERVWDIARILRPDPEELRQFDPRAPVDELRRMTESDRNYAVAFRTMAEKARSANDLIAFLNSKPLEMGQVRARKVLRIASAICGLAVASPAIAKSGKFETIYTFGSVPNDGTFPSAPLISANGMLYGTTALGGPENSGTVYTINPATGNEAIVSNLIGGEARAPVMFYRHDLIGTTTSSDTIFSVDLKTKHVTKLHSFPFGGDDQPAQPNGLTVFDGTFFGTTVDGGRLGCGYVYGFDPVGHVFSKLHTFNCVDGEYPEGDLAVHEGLLYGVTEQGGQDQSGTIFSVDPMSGAKKTLQSLDCSAEGCFPTGIAFYKGIMFGSALYGGVADSGTLFTFDPATLQYTTLFAFLGGAGGCEPVGAPAVFKGKLYGVALGCINMNKYGVLYEVSLKTGKERVLHTFTNGADGGSPDAGLLLYEGALYGTTADGGAYTNGTVFRYVP